MFTGLKKYLLNLKLNKIKRNYDYTMSNVSNLYNFRCTKLKNIEKSNNLKNKIITRLIISRNF